MKKSLHLAALCLGVASLAADNVGVASTSWLHQGTPNLQSAGALAFAPDGILVVGDSPGSAIFALDVSAAEAAGGGASPDTAHLRGLDARVAARLGVAPAQIRINDMAVHPRSRAIYLSVTRGLGARARPALLRVGADSRVDVVSLAGIRFSRMALPDPPRPGARDEDGGDAFGRAITDLVVANGSVYVAGLTNGEFSSTLRRVPLPFTSTLSSTGLRFYHAHHSRFETRSAVTALATYSSGGRDFLVVSYACTPVALFPIDSLTDGARVTGKTIAELGAGTHTTSLVTFASRNRRYLAVVTLARSIQLLFADSLAHARGLGPGDGPRNDPLGSWASWGIPAYSGGVPGVVNLADFSESLAAAISRNPESGALDLLYLRKPLLW